MRLCALVIATLISTTPAIAQEISATANCVDPERLEPGRPDTDAIDCTITGSISAEATEPSPLLSDSELVLPGTLSLITRNVKLEIPLPD